MKRDKRAGAEAGVGPTGFSTGAMPAYSDGRGAPDGIRSVTNRSRASRNGAVVFAVVVFVLAFGIVLAAAQAAFAEHVLLKETPSYQEQARAFPQDELSQRRPGKTA